MSAPASGDGDVPADGVAAWATGAGVGLVVFIVSWLLWRRILIGVFSTPIGPVATMIVGVVSGTTAGWCVSRRMVWNRVREPGWRPRRRRVRSRRRNRP
ncbi:MAG: hypothetical protein WEE36_11050 [Acidimicrobiia bacterium]